MAFAVGVLVPLVAAPQVERLLLEGAALGLVRHGGREQAAELVARVVLRVAIVVDARVHGVPLLAHVHARHAAAVHVAPELLLQPPAQEGVALSHVRFRHGHGREGRLAHSARHLDVRAQGRTHAVREHALAVALKVKFVPVVNMVLEYLLAARVRANELALGRAR